MDETLHFVDLPGYGYARASAEQRNQWKRLIEAYLRNRGNLVLSFLLLDARREVVVHEVGHYFGLTEPQLREIEAIEEES